MQVTIRAFELVSLYSLTCNAPSTGEAYLPDCNRTAEVAKSALVSRTIKPFSKFRVYEYKSAHKSRYPPESGAARCHVLGESAAALTVEVVA